MIGKLRRLARKKRPSSESQPLAGVMHNISSKCDAVIFGRAKLSALPRRRRNGNKNICVGVGFQALGTTMICASAEHRGGSMFFQMDVMKNLTARKDLHLSTIKSNTSGKSYGCGIPAFTGSRRHDEPKSDVIAALEPCHAPNAQALIRSSQPNRRFSRNLGQQRDGVVQVHKLCGHSRTHAYCERRPNDVAYLGTMSNSRDPNSYEIRHGRYQAFAISKNLSVSIFPAESAFWRTHK